MISTLFFFNLEISISSSGCCFKFYLKVKFCQRDGKLIKTSSSGCCFKLYLKVKLCQRDDKLIKPQKANIIGKKK